jgi:hypothetical protein
MAGPKPAALPLGDTPQFLFFKKDLLQFNCSIIDKEFKLSIAKKLFYKKNICLFSI